MNNQTSKQYACKRDGTVSRQVTNHYGNTYSVGHYNTCSTCPPWAKYPEFGGSTVWVCLESPEQSLAPELLR